MWLITGMGRVDGTDGLGGVHTTAPQYTPQGLWAHLFDCEAQLEAGETRTRHIPKNFRPSNVPAHREMLKILREEEEGTVTIVAVGPLTNLALAAEEDVCVPPPPLFPSAHNYTRKEGDMR